MVADEPTRPRPPAIRPQLPPGRRRHMSALGARLRAAEAFADVRVYAERGSVVDPDPPCAGTTGGDDATVTGGDDPVRKRTPRRVLAAALLVVTGLAGVAVLGLAISAGGTTATLERAGVASPSLTPSTGGVAGQHGTPGATPGSTGTPSASPSGFGSAAPVPSGIEPTPPNPQPSPPGAPSSPPSPQPSASSPGSPKPSKPKPTRPHRGPGDTGPVENPRAGAAGIAA